MRGERPGLKPCCSFIKILLTGSWIYYKIRNSNNFEIWDRIDIGLKFKIFDEFPVLGMGMPTLSLNINGKVPLSSDCLKRVKRGYVMIDFILREHHPMRNKYYWAS